MAADILFALAVLLCALGIAMARRARSGPQSTLASLLVAIGIVLALAGAAFAHDHTRPDLNDWFPTLHSRGNIWCCDGPRKDALHLRDADWETKDGHYRVRVPKDIDSFNRAIAGEDVETEWVDVPDDAVIDAPNRAGATLVWPSYGYQRGVRCFMPGTLS